MDIWRTRLRSIRVHRFRDPESCCDQKPAKCLSASTNAILSHISRYISGQMLCDKGSVSTVQCWSLGLDMSNRQRLRSYFSSAHMYET